MIMIVGGSSQGKLAFAAELMKIDREAMVCADGSKDSFEAVFSASVIDGFHQYIRRMILEGLDWETWVRQVIKECGQSILLMDEVGCGIVPMERADREYRDAAGKAGQMLAAEAEIVYRVICGIGTRIK